MRTTTSPTPALPSASARTCWPSSTTRNRSKAAAPRSTHYAGTPAKLAGSSLLGTMAGQAPPPAQVGASPDRLRTGRGKPAEQLDVVVLVVAAGRASTELVASPTAEVEARQQPPGRDGELLGQAAPGDTVDDGGVGIERDDRLKLGVEDHLVGEPVFTDPRAARASHQQRPAEPSERGSRGSGERRVLKQRAGAGERLRGHRLREPRPPGTRSAPEGEAVLPVGRAAAVDGASNQGGRQPTHTAPPLLRHPPVEYCEAQQRLKLVAGAGIGPEREAVAASVKRDTRTDAGARGAHRAQPTLCGFDA